jgi:hypothetical protein
MSHEIKLEKTILFIIFNLQSYVLVVLFYLYKSLI